MKTLLIAACVSAGIFATTANADQIVDTDEKGHIILARDYVAPRSTGAQIIDTDEKGHVILYRE